MKKLFVSATMAAAALASVPAHAVSVSFNYTNTNVLGGDQSGKTSPYLAANNLATANVFVETFDARNGGGNGQGCALDTPSNLVTLAGGTYDVRKGTVSSLAAAPAGDSSCFAYGPTANGTLPDVVKVNYAGLISTIGTTLNYLGLYYGSIDTYNDLIFYNTAGQVITTVTGASLISQFQGISGNQQNDSSNIYVNLLFSPGEQFASFAFSTTGRAFEMDNVAVGFNVSAIPEPTSLALFGLSLAALGVARRRKNSV